MGALMRAKWFGLGLLFLIAGGAWRSRVAHAPATLPLLIAGYAGGTSYSVPIRPAVLHGAGLCLPVLLMMTAFYAYRHRAVADAPGAGYAVGLPNQVIIGLSLGTSRSSS